MPAQTDDISLSYIRKELQNYNFDTLRSDLLAGLQVSFLTIPQSMAYALMAGLPLSCGLFAAIFSSIIAALFGSSRYLVVGPVNAIAILAQTGTAEILFTYFREASGIQREILALQIITQLSLIVGAFQVLAAFLKLGRLTQFVSYSVVVGYLAGSAVTIVVNQLFTFLGMYRLTGVSSLYEKSVYILNNLQDTHIPTLTVGLLTLSFIFICKKINKTIPGAALALIVMAGGIYFLQDTPYDWFRADLELVGDTVEAYGLFPSFAWPSFNTGIMHQMLPFAFAVALLSVMDTTCVSKSIASSKGNRVSINQEMLGVGLGNLVSAFTSAMPVSGSPSRTVLNMQSGAQTRMAAIFNALFVAAIVQSLGFLVNSIPLASLSILLFITASTMLNYKQLFLCLKATSSDAFVMIITFLSCIFFPLDVAFYIGVFLSVTLYLNKAALPQLKEYDIEESGELRDLDPTEACLHKTIRVIKVEGELFFGSADIFQGTLKSIAEDDTSTRVIVLQLKNARDIDATSCLAFLQLHDYLKGGGRHLVACGLSQEIWDVMSNSGVIEQVGKENLFVFDARHPHQHMQKAIHRARELAKPQLTSLASEPAEVTQLRPESV